MARFKILLLVCFAAVSGALPARGQFITDPQVRADIHRDFYERMATLDGLERRRHLLELAADTATFTTDELDAFMFLAAYAPLRDLAECEAEYFICQVQYAFRARDYFPWGMTVPEDIFRHFVLPHRVNNENLDEARDVFFEELKDRIGGMSMYDAALEVNHWCHEKVEYRATDARTSAPLALVRTSWGRCGEESAFTATALRAVGIPARQVYTPRWVHTDSNHAWVEVWIDGRWHYLGACEPEPRLDMAWFTLPATRAMMMHTTVLGRYRGPEEVSLATDWYTTINLLENYAPIRRITVSVTDGEGRPVEGAAVKYKAYNYGEFYPIATYTTDAEGRSGLTTGRGDILIWASKGEDHGYVKLAAGTDHAAVRLGDGRPERSERFVMNVPRETPVESVPSDMVAENRRRLAREDSIRNAYMATFRGEGELSRRLAASTGIAEGRVAEILRLSQGNWQQIARLMEKNGDDPLFDPFIASLTDKDLRDTPQDYLSDHLKNQPLPPYEFPDSLMAAKVLSPRIDMEIITPWRDYFRRQVFERGGLERDPEKIMEYVARNIRIDPVQNYVACLATPSAVHKLKVADRRSRDVYFVALCRTAGIPAHIDRATGTPQFYRNGRWQDAVFEQSASGAAVRPTGTITLHSGGDNRIEPAYRTHFTLALFEDGDFSTLDLAGELAGRGYPATVTVPAGYYRLTAGSRANDGSVAVSTRYFHLTADGARDLEIEIPEPEGKLLVEGILDMNTTVFLADGAKTSLKEQARGEGLILVFADPAGEPTRHILQEMPAYRTLLEEWGGGVVFVVPDQVAGATFNRSIFEGLPSQARWIPDAGNTLLNEATRSLRIAFDREYPLTLYLNTSGGILFSHKGYRLGVVESLWRTIKAEREMIDN